MEKSVPKQDYIKLKKELQENTDVEKPILDFRSEEEKDMDIIEIERKYQKDKLKIARDLTELYNKMKETMIRKGDEKIITLQVDGSEHSKFALNMICEEFLKNFFVHCVHISDSAHDEKFNWRYKKQFVVEYFNAKLKTLNPNQSAMSLEEMDKKKALQIDQVYQIAKKNKSSYLFCGYFGLRTQTLQVEAFNKGVGFLLTEPRIPIVMIKEQNLRGTKNVGFKWLLLMDRASSLCFKSLESFIPLIDLNVDFIFGLTMLPPYIANDDVKPRFLNRMAELNLKENQYAYFAQQYDRSPSDFSINFVNHNSEHYFDFVIFYNNPDKYKIEKEKSESTIFINKLAANICFVNTVFIGGESKQSD